MPASPASASPCPSPYNYQYVITGLTLTQPSTSSNVGTSLTLTGTVSGSSRQGGFSGVCLDLTVVGANAMPDQAVNPAADGSFSFTYTGGKAGADSISVTSAPDAQQGTKSATVRHSWVAPPSPTPKPTPSPTPRQTTPPPAATRTPSPLPSTTVSPSASSTPSATPSATPTPASSSPTPTPVAPPTPTLGGGSVTLDRPSALPGGTLTVTGKGCPAGSKVSFGVEGAPAGTTTARADGTFSSPVALPNAPIGAHPVTVSCAGAEVSLPLDLVVASATAVAPALGVTVAAVLVFFVLLGSVLLNRTHTGRRRSVD